MSYFVHAGMDARDVDAMLDPLPIEWILVDKQLANLAGCLQRPPLACHLAIASALPWRSAMF